MGCLIDRDFLQVLIKRIGEAGRQEVVAGVIRQAGAIKGIFEVLQGQGVVENVGFEVGNECN